MTLIHRKIRIYVEQLKKTTISKLNLTYIGYGFLSTLLLYQIKAKILVTYNHIPKRDFVRNQIQFYFGNMPAKAMKYLHREIISLFNTQFETILVYFFFLIPTINTDMVRYI
jgi:hypothetical protein